MAGKLKILLTNDDGAEAHGLMAVRDQLAELGQVVVVAPYEEKSAVSHGLTLHYPIRTIELGSDHYALTGTPADCVLFALRQLLPEPPDLVVSGINHGANLGDDILYSGTVAGAREASINGIPSLAVSQVLDKQSAPDFKTAAAFVRSLIEDLFPERIPPGGFLNVNIPKGKLAGYRFTRQGSKRAASKIEEKLDPRGRKYYWIGPDESEWIIEADTDYQAIQDGVVSITPLHRDQTDYRGLRNLTRVE